MLSTGCLDKYVIKITKCSPDVYTTPPPELRNVFFDKFLEHRSNFGGAADTPVLGLLVMSPLVSKPEWAALCALGGGILRNVFGLQILSP